MQRVAVRDVVMTVKHRGENELVRGNSNRGVTVRFYRLLDQQSLVK